MKMLSGTAVAVLIAIAATFISSHYGGPQLLYALLFGLVLNVLYDKPTIRPGVDFAARVFLRIGVALLGVRITLDQVGELGFASLVLIASAVALTIGTGWLLSRLLKRPASEGVLSGSAVGICGASAALAVSAALPAGKHTERFTLMTVVGVTLLSTLAMIFYPLLTKLLALEPIQAGIFIGGTIHDVAQVVAAGMLLGENAADTATIIKLFRVLMLLPVVLLVSLAFRQRHNATTTQRSRPPLLPGFLLGFVILVLLASAGVLPASAVDAASLVSRECLVIAIAAVGVKTSFRDLSSLGWQPILMLSIETLVLAVFVISGIVLLGLPI